MGGVLLGLLVQVGIAPPPFLVQVGEEGKEERREGRRGAPPPPLVQFGLGKGGRQLWPALSLLQ